MTSHNFWAESWRWPDDTQSHVFLARAVGQLGKAMFPFQWTGDEPLAKPEMPLPNRIDAERRDRLSAHRLLVGDPMYEAKPRPTQWPGSVNRLQPGPFSEDYDFSELEWQIAQEKQEVTLAARRPSWARLSAVWARIKEEAIFARLGTAYRKDGMILLTPIIADAWAVFKTHEVFEWCTLPATPRLGVTTLPLFVSRADLERLTTDLRAASEKAALSAMYPDHIDPAQRPVSASVDATVSRETDLVLLTRPMFNLHAALVASFGSSGGYATQKTSVRETAAAAWQRKQAKPLPILPGSLQRSILRLDDKVFRSGKTVKLKA